MKLPLSWLKDYVALDATPAELARRLTFSGIEVEGIETVGGAFPGVIVGEVRAVAKHPNADRLRLCRVFDGTRELQVVCGAPNVAVGAKAPLAPVGTTLPNGITLKPAKIRGEVSEGMLCAEDELGLSAAHDGILQLDKGLAAGTPLATVLGPPDTVLHLEMTWNRPDCLSVIGVAREVAALFNLPLRRPEPAFETHGPAIDGLMSVAVEDAAGCPRYTARWIEGVRADQPSPEWMQRRLKLAGVRPISVIVDITNYVMLECGQPLHAFDAELIGGARIVVRRARAGERIVTLDGRARELQPDTLVIADAARPMAVAGIMGGEGSEIGPRTTRVLLESAIFDAPLIHASTVRLGMTSESAHRFERGVEIEGADWASRRAIALMVEHAGGRAAPGALDVRVPPRPPRRIRCRWTRLDSLLGFAVPRDEAVAIFRRLELPVTARDAAGCEVEAPSFRLDLEREADLIEEIARMHGLDAVPDVVPAARVVPDANEGDSRAVAGLRRALVGLGLTEIMNYSFCAGALFDVFDPNDAAARVVLPNPVSADHGLLRHRLTPQVVETLGRNLARQVPALACFELGRVFRPEAAHVGEDERLVIGLMGPVGRVGPDGHRPVTAEEMFLWLKGILERLAAEQHVRDLAFEPAEAPWLRADAAVAVKVGGRVIGLAGLLADSVRRHWRMLEPVGVAEIETRALLRRAGLAAPLAPVPVFPAVNRDVALVVDESVPHGDIVARMRAAAPEELTDIRLFDIFRGEAIGAGRKSLAYTLVYRSGVRTLTDEEANRFHETIKQALRDRLGATIREG